MEGKNFRSEEKSGRAGKRFGTKSGRRKGWSKAQGTVSFYADFPLFDFRFLRSPFPLCFLPLTFFSFDNSRLKFSLLEPFLLHDHTNPSHHYRQHPFPRSIFLPTILSFRSSLIRRPFLSYDRPFSYDPYPSDQSFLRPSFPSDHPSDDNHFFLSFSYAILILPINLSSYHPSPTLLSSDHPSFPPTLLFTDHSFFQPSFPPP